MAVALTMMKLRNPVEYGETNSQLLRQAAKVNGVLGQSMGQILQLSFCLAIAIGLGFSASWEMALLVLVTLPLQVTDK
jgi:ABC-type multidrug transport system fused ATPase/permease subunit